MRGIESSKIINHGEMAMKSKHELTAKMEPFDSFWEAPDNIESGYAKLFKFYKHNYLRYLPADRDANILAISCGPGYFVNLLTEEGYRNVLGIDSFPDKVEYAKKHNLNCKVARAYEFLEESKQPYDVIFCEQELNHLTKEEILDFVPLCARKLRPGGILLVHALNGANPITGAEALAQNFDHYNPFTEYTMRQVLEHCHFEKVKVFPLNLYVFYTNPLNYVLMLMSALYTAFFRISFIMYGKKNKLFTKKIGAVGYKKADA